MSATSTLSRFRIWSCNLWGSLATNATLSVAGMTLLTGLSTPSLYAQATARPPERLSFQGFLVDGNGDPLGKDAPKNYDIIFRIYDADTGGELLWSESQTVTVDQGHFSVLLGEGIAVGSEVRPALSTLFRGPSASQRFVQIAVKGLGQGGSDAVIEPRLQLLSSPYAFLSEQSTRLVSSETGADLLTSSFVNDNHQLTINGSVSVANSLTAANFLGSGAGLTGVLKPTDVPNLDFSNGHLWLNTPGLGASGGYGKALIFSSPGENTDPLWIARYNKLNNQTELRINIGDDSNDAAVADKLVIGTTSGGGFNQSGNWEPRFAFDSRGYLGIRTESPTVPLEVAGTVGIIGSNFIEFGYKVDNKQKDAGKIGYGTWMSDALNIVGAGESQSSRKVQIYAEGGTAFTGLISVQNPSRASQYVNIERTQNAVVLRAAGGLFHTSSEKIVSWDGDNNWDWSSDVRLKKDIEDAEPMLERALKVRLRRYHWKDDDSNRKKILGVIAQELQPLFPDMVGEIENPTTKETHLTVGYSDFGMIAIKALQELKTLYDKETAALRTEIAALKEERKAQAEAEKARSLETVALQERLAAVEKLLQETVAANKTKSALETAQVVE